MNKLADSKLQQALEAREIAQTVRKKRWEMKRSLKTGDHAVLRLVLNPPDWLQTMSVFEFAMAIPGVGRHKMLGYVSMIESSEMRPLGELTQRQRDILHRALSEHYVFRKET